MATLTAIIEPSPDETLHLPLPAELRSSKIRVIASVTPIDSQQQIPHKNRDPGCGCLKGKIHMAHDFEAPLNDFEDYME